MGSYLAWIAAHRKFLTVAVGAVVTGLTFAFGADNPYVTELVAVVSALGVYVVPNAPRPPRDIGPITLPPADTLLPRKP